MHNILNTAINTSQRAQRNYDLSKSIPDSDLETLIHAAVNSPSKQNETHYSLNVYTDQQEIYEIYKCTKKFTTQVTPEEHTYMLNTGNALPDDRYILNSQIMANALFIYSEFNGKSNCSTHWIAQHSPVDALSNKLYQEQKTFSIGISAGELILTAALLGYKTGICSAFDSTGVGKIINADNSSNIRLLVGVGFENAGVDRQLHYELLNKDVPETLRTGELSDHWKFPSFNKTVEVKVNGKLL